jgi:hypothetical protein
MTQRYIHYSIFLLVVGVVKEWLKLAQNGTKIVGMIFHLLSKDKRLLIEKKCINNIYVNFDDASNGNN